MGLFQKQVDEVQRFWDVQQQRGRLTKLTLDLHNLWPAGRSLVLQHDAGLDLGNPAVGSVSALVWSGAEDSSHEGLDQAYLVGPDLRCLTDQTQSLPTRVAFAQLIHLSGQFEDSYARYLDIKEAMYSLDLEGVTLRSMPSRQHLWLRIHRQALQRGFGLSHLASKLIRNFRQLDFVSQVSILYITQETELIDRLGTHRTRLRPCRGGDD